MTKPIDENAEPGFYHVRGALWPLFSEEALGKMEPEKAAELVLKLGQRGLNTKYCMVLDKPINLPGEKIQTAFLLNVLPTVKVCEKFNATVGLYQPGELCPVVVQYHNFHS